MLNLCFIYICKDITILILQCLGSSHSIYATVLCGELWLKSNASILYLSKRSAYAKKCFVYKIYLSIEVLMLSNDLVYKIGLSIIKWFYVCNAYAEKLFCIQKKVYLLKEMLILRNYIVQNVYQSKRSDYARKWFCVQN